MLRKISPRKSVSLLILALSLNVSAQQKQTVEMGKTSLNFWVDANGRPLYNLSWNGKPVIRIRFGIVAQKMAN
jgi:hypothetical protein